MQILQCVTCEKAFIDREVKSIMRYFIFYGNKETLARYTLQC
jgi:hypothetical protein